MPKPRLLALLLSVFALPAVGPAMAGGGFDQEHPGFATLLKQHVHDGWVEYAALKAAPRQLNEYLDLLSAVPEVEFNDWKQSDRLAFLINLYNAATLKLIVDHYPVKSIKDIGGWFGSPWKQAVVRVFGQVITLDELEHGIIRPQYHDARVHFALVCAARGCPPLRVEAFVGARLDGQLTDQGRSFFSQGQKNRVDAAAHIVYLSPIFKWFGEDFEAQGGTVLKFAGPYFPAEQQRALAVGEFQINYTEYDWSLNDSAKK